jgi:thiamine-monophosphate kinase
VNEFELIDAVVAELGDAAAGAWVRLGPGDDAAVTALPAGMELVSSIDALVAGVHFPTESGGALVGYRAMMVSASDLAAMGADPGFALVSVSLSADDEPWLLELARGLGEAARELSLPLVGGNLARGPRTVAVSVHGYVPTGAALTRSAGRPGEDVFVTGGLGAAAAALARGGLEQCRTLTDLDGLSRAYFRPPARLAAGRALRGVAGAVIDLSDGLLQDLGHVCRASGAGVELDSSRIPVAEGADLAHALTGGDDYELCFTARAIPTNLGVPVHRIGRVVAEPGVRLDGRPAAGGYQHFGR